MTNIKQLYFSQNYLSEYNKTSRKTLYKLEDSNIFH